MSILRTRDSRQSITVTTPPDYDFNLPVTVAELKQWLKLSSGNTEDDILKELEITAIEWIESAARRYLTPQAITMTLDHWPCQENYRTGLASTGVNSSPVPDCSILLNKLPVNSIDEIRYIEIDGSINVVDPSIYVLDNASDRKPSRIFEAPTKVWPTQNQRRFNSVEIDMQVGYASGLVPAQIINAILRLTSKLYEDRGDCDTDTCAKSCGIMKMLSSYTVPLF